MASIDMHSHHSTLRERIVEHVFVGEALRTLWRRGITDVEVLRSEFDAHGYDLVTLAERLRHLDLRDAQSLSWALLVVRRGTRRSAS